MPFRRPYPRFGGSSPGMDREQVVGYALRYLHIFVLIAAVACSGKLLTSCEFVSFRSDSVRPWPALIPPFASSRNADVGLFSYRITNSTDRADETATCQPFQSGKFESFHEGNIDSGTFENRGYWIAAQYSSVLGLAFGLLGIVIVLVQDSFTSCPAGRLFTAASLAMAVLFQGCTFLFMKDSNFCFNLGSHSCSFGPGGWSSIVSTLLYLLSLGGVFVLPPVEPLIPKMIGNRKERLYDSSYNTDEASILPKKILRPQKFDLILPSLPEESIDSFQTTPTGTSLGEASGSNFGDLYFDEFTDEIASHASSSTRSISSGSTRSRSTASGSRPRRSPTPRGLSEIPSSTQSRVSILDGAGNGNANGDFDSDDEKDDESLLFTDSIPSQPVQARQDSNDDSFSMIANRTTSAGRSDTFSFVASRRENSATADSSIDDSLSVIADRSFHSHRNNSFSLMTESRPRNRENLDDSFSVIANRNNARGRDISFSVVDIHQANHQSNAFDDSFSVIANRTPRRGRDYSFSMIEHDQQSEDRDSLSDDSGRDEVNIRDDSFSVMVERATSCQRDDSFSAIASRATVDDSFSAIANRRNRDDSFPGICHQPRTSSS